MPRRVASWFRRSFRRSGGTALIVLKMADYIARTNPSDRGGDREKQIERMMTNTVGLHGELQGIIGTSLPKIDALELDAMAALPAAPEDE